MKQQENKRRISAWILIAVFVPMLLLSFTHTHSVGSSQSVECQECLHHVHHTHLGTADSCIDNCVLCQMLSVVYYPAVALVGIMPVTMLGMVSSTAMFTVCCRVATSRRGALP